MKTAMPTTNVPNRQRGYLISSKVKLENIQKRNKMIVEMLFPNPVCVYVPTRTVENYNQPS